MLVHKDKKINTAQDLLWRNADQRGVIQYVDIQDQDPNNYFLMVDLGPMQNLVFAVDHIDIQDHVIFGVAGGDVIVQFSDALPWYAVRSNYTRLITTQQMAEHHAVDNKLMEELHKKLYPEEQNTKPDIPIGQYA